MNAKSLLISTIFVAALTLSGCATSVSITNNNEMRATYSEIDPNIPRSGYTILQKVTCSSDYVSLDGKNLSGDSHKYGSYKQLAPVVVSKRAQKDVNVALETARSNALYEVIQKTNELGGDTILEPLEQIETKIETKGKKEKYYYKVTITALAVQINRD